ncbi:MAG: glycosyltransferase [Nitrospirae bacterium]|nr:glycosyltransferase [Nitrospirota bacterium]
MNCYNGEEFLQEAIDSIYAQTFIDWEIIFWDNASADRSAEIAKSYNDGRMRYFRSKNTVPLGEARNYAIEQLRGQYIAFLDCDDIWLPEKLNKQVTILEEKPGIDFIYSNYFKIVMPRADKRIIGLKGKQPEGDVFEKFLYQYPVNLQTVIFRKEVLNKLDYFFDKKLNLSEEFDLFMRIFKNSTVSYESEPSIITRIHRHMSSLRYARDYYDECMYIAEKFKTADNDFENKYGVALRYFYAKANYYRARSEMSESNSRKARECLRTYKFLDIKFYGLYLITYLPNIIWRMLHRAKDRGII